MKHDTLTAGPGWLEHPTIGLEGREWRWHIGMVAESTRVYDVGKCFAGYEIPVVGFERVTDG